MAMVDFAEQSTEPNSPDFTIREDDYSRLGQNSNLYKGACNYRDVGGNGQQCGCRQFFDETFGRSGNGSLYFCMCTHHVCFHDQGDRAVERTSARSILRPILPSIGDVENEATERSRQMRQECLRPQNMQLENDLVPRSQTGSNQSFNYVNALDAQSRSQGFHGGPNIGAGQAMSSLPDTLPWNRSARTSQAGFTVLPPIPPNCLFESQERIDQEHYQAEGTQASGSEISSAKRPYADVRAKSFLTVQKKIISPSGFPLQQKITSTHNTSHSSANQDQPNVTRNEIEAVANMEDVNEVLLPARVLQRISEMDREINDLSTLISAQGQRLDCMENVSFSHKSDDSDVHGKLQEKQEDMEERLESMEIRQDECDGRLIEIEKSLDNESSQGCVRCTVDNGSTSGGGSFTHQLINAASVDPSLLIALETRVAALEAKIQRGSVRRIIDSDSTSGGTITSAIINAASPDPSLLNALDTRVAELEAEIQSAAPPTRDQPWNVEVVFLPFGSSLKGIWSTIEDFPSQSSRRSSMAADDRSQANLEALPSAEDRPGSWEKVVAEEYHAEDSFLVARSPNRQSVMYRRLKSRGYVLTVEILGPTARDVNAALVSSFGNLPRLSGIKDHDMSKRLTDIRKTYHALDSFWLPLRKFHKDSRLRFLDPPELISQTLWTVEFLKSSVVMRGAGLPILFLTHSQAYTQHLTTPEDHWTWPKLRALRRFDSGPDETCWKYDWKVDTLQPTHSLSIHTSIDSAQSMHSSLAATHSLSNCQPPSVELDCQTSHSNDFSSFAPSPSGASTSSESVSPTLEVRNPQTKLRRTTPVSMRIPLRERPSLSKRKSTCSPDIYYVDQKRRRSSRSSSRPRNTPRWSTGPGDNDPVEFTRVGATTSAFGISTPHSTDYRAYHHDVDDDDDEANTTQNAEFDISMGDYESGHEAAQHDEIEWEGVDDGNDDNDGNESDSGESDRSIGRPPENLNTMPPEDGIDDNDGNESDFNDSDGSNDPPSEHPNRQPPEDGSDDNDGNESDSNDSDCLNSPPLDQHPKRQPPEDGIDDNDGNESDSDDSDGSNGPPSEHPSTQPPGWNFPIYNDKDEDFVVDRGD